MEFALGSEKDSEITKVPPEIKRKMIRRGMIQRGAHERAGPSASVARALGFTSRASGSRRQVERGAHEAGVSERPAIHAADPRLVREPRATPQRARNGRVPRGTQGTGSLEPSRARARSTLEVRIICSIGDALGFNLRMRLLFHGQAPGPRDGRRATRRGYRPPTADLPPSPAFVAKEGARFLPTLCA